MDGGLAGWLLTAGWEGGEGGGVGWGGGQRQQQEAAATPNTTGEEEEEEGKKKFLCFDFDWRGFLTEGVSHSGSAHPHTPHFAREVPATFSA